jgi:NAD(P)-dependent dehydrogenase (short-subunit alcohol dehydrogenase family)
MKKDMSLISNIGMNQFEGKTAVISGGAEGIGLSIAQALGDQKMNIVIADIDQENLQKAGSELEAAGISVLTVVLNVADEAQWQEVAIKHWLDLAKSIWLSIMQASVEIRVL